MKIGVFGDSFADSQAGHIWWRYLQDDHGHQVRSFGQAGSSLGFSVDCMTNHGGDFDHLIWCVTTVNRISIWHHDRVYHSTGTQKSSPTGDFELDRKLEIIHHYLTEAFDFHFQEIMGHALVDYMLKKYPNLTIIPSFSTPVYFMQEHRFNLFDLCKMEAEHAYPDRAAEDIINSSRDRRQGHLTKTNQKRLAALINDQLQSGIFCTGYNNFSFDKKTLGLEFNGT